MSQDWWTDERVERLKRLWTTTKMTASEIADEMGCTKGMVSGKVHRLNLTGRAVLKRKPKPAPKPKAEPRKENGQFLSAPPPVEAPKWDLSGHAEGEPKPKHLALFDLKEASCRFPFGGPGNFTFCGHIRENEKDPYCPFHNQLSYVAPQSRVRQPSTFVIKKGAGSIIGGFKVAA